MDKTIRQLFSLLAAAMGTKENIEDRNEVDWNRIYALSKIHKIAPMIYEAADNDPSFCRDLPALRSEWKDMTINNSMNQMLRSMQFLRLYDLLIQSGVQTLVIKGVICRELYPNHDYRSSGDEDIYIRREDYELANKIVQDYGMKPEKSINIHKPEPVTTYTNPKYNLRLELHVDLFDPYSELFGPWNKLFSNSFEDCIIIDIEGYKVHTLSYDKNLLFLILHIIKHFLNIGFGIRQVCDLVMYCNKYGSMIDWDWLWDHITDLGYGVFVMNLFDIGQQYLGLQADKIRLLPGWKSEDLHSEALLMDIMSAGIYGKNIPSRTKTSYFTHQAVRMDRKKRENKWGKATILRSVFPDLDYMGKHYPYCRRYPVLLPLAWINRIIKYIFEQSIPGGTKRKADVSYAIGKKRIELLKEYKIISIDND